MIRKSLYTATLILIGFVGSQPQEASAGTLTLLCWNGTPLGTIEAPIPTVGCTMTFAPGGDGHIANFVGSWPGCSPNCVINPNEWTVAFIDIRGNRSGSRNQQLAFNCVGQIISVTVVSVAQAFRIRRPEPEVVQEVSHFFQNGTAGIWCPQNPIGMGAPAGQ